MFNITLRPGIRTTTAELYQALTTDEGLSSWWTRDTRAAGPVGSLIQFWFNDTCVEFEVAELVPNHRVRWKHHGTMPEDWMGTEIVFDIEEAGEQVYVNFAHNNWKEQGHFMSHCSLKWGVFMLSLKDALETGKGRPFPDDIWIDHAE